MLLFTTACCSSIESLSKHGLFDQLLLASHGLCQGLRTLARKEVVIGRCWQRWLQNILCWLWHHGLRLHWDTVIICCVCSDNAVLGRPCRWLVLYQIIFLRTKIDACLHHSLLFLDFSLFLSEFKVFFSAECLSLCVGLGITGTSRWLWTFSARVLHKEWTYLWWWGRSSWWQAVREMPCQRGLHIQRVKWAYLCRSFVL